MLQLNQKSFLRCTVRAFTFLGEKVAAECEECQSGSGGRAEQELLSGEPADEEDAHEDAREARQGHHDRGQQGRVQGRQEPAVTEIVELVVIRHFGVESAYLILLGNLKKVFFLASSFEFHF